MKTRLDLDQVRQGLNSQVILKARGITKRFLSVLALDDVSFALGKGEIHALLGENGSGKTTLASIFYGIHSPDAGEINLGGSRVLHQKYVDVISLEEASEYLAGLGRESDAKPRIRN